ncbi:MAG TPA: glycerate kinase [Gemmatimonadota bacterium]|nr:glycerate kinase [Gemmatimonadota bacterium]
MRVVLAPGSFKGSFDAVEVALAFEEALAGRAEPVLAPMSDGGDGLLAVLRHYRPDVLAVHARVPDPAGREILALWGWDPEKGAAYLESAAAIGLRLLDPGRRDPLRTTSAGLGRLIRTAAGLGPEEIVIGLGGSATVDAGLGMARELGFRFEDEAGRSIERPVDLPRLARIVPPAEPAVPSTTRVIALADVTAPLHGPDGAARAFGAQKGADPDGIERLAEALERMEEAWRADLGAPSDLAVRPGAGAAGGLGAALAAFLGAGIASGSEWCSRRARLEEALVGADAIVTGEGRFDRQSLGGKATGHVLALAEAAGIPAAVVCASHEMGTREAGTPVVDAAAIGRPPEELLRREDLVRMMGVVLDRWEADPARDILAPR